MNPYYEDPYITLYLGDCQQITNWLAADVLVTDPPYGMNYESNRNRDKRNTKLGSPIAKDDTVSARNQALAAWGEDRPALVFGKWTQPRPKGTRARLIWDKRIHGTGDLSLPWGPTDEEIYVIGTGFTGQRTSNILSVQMLNSQARDRPNHPTPKPIGLMERLIDRCPPGVIADPFAGSGTTLIAAKNLGRRAIGVELDEHYCEIAANRLTQDTLFGDLTS